MPTDFIAWLSLIGALAFGLVVGWVTYGTLRRSKRGALTDITTVIGAVAGATITALFPRTSGDFGAYCLGLAIGFFGYLAAAKRPNAPDWLGEAPGAGGTGRGEAPGTTLPRTAQF